MRSASLAFLVFSLGFTIAHAAVTDLVLFGGQSNAVGALGSFGLPPSIPNPIDVPYFYHVTAGATHLDGSGQLTPIWSTGGPELSFADSLYDQGNPVTIVKTAVNGSSLFTEWDHRRPESYSHTLIAKTHEALAAIPNSRVVGMIWIQGESDATSWGRANAYCDNMLLFSDVLHNEFGEFPIYYNQLHAQAVAPWRDLVRQEQAELDTYDGFIMLNMDDLIMRDDLHFTADSIVGMGRKFAEAVDPVTDLDVWRQSFGIDDGFDLDDDGVTDGNDFLLWQRMNSTSLAAVPEPKFGLTGILLAAILYRRSNDRD